MSVLMHITLVLEHCMEREYFMHPASHSGIVMSLGIVTTIHSAHLPPSLLQTLDTATYSYKYKHPLRHLPRLNSRLDCVAPHEEIL